MARSTAEIQADIAMTRQRIEAQLDALRRRVPNRWWTPYAVLGGALIAGLILSRAPMLATVRTSARAVEAGLAVLSTAAAVNRFLAERPARRKAA